MGASAFLRDEIADHLLGTATWTAPADIYVSLHDGDPGTTGSDEVSGNAYARVQHNTWNAASGGVATNSGTVTWPTATGDYASPVTHFGLWDASSGGNFLGGGQLDDPRTILQDDTPEAADAALSVTVS